MNPPPIIKQKRDWINTATLLTIALMLVATAYMQFEKRGNIPYLSCRDKVQKTMTRHKNKFNRTYSIAIDYHTGRTDLEELLHNMASYVYTTKTDEEFFGGKFCSSDIAALIKKSRGKIFLYREALVANNQSVSLKKMIDELQFIHTKINNYNPDDFCCQ